MKNVLLFSIAFNIVFGVKTKSILQMNSNIMIQNIHSLYFVKLNFINNNLEKSHFIWCL